MNNKCHKYEIKLKLRSLKSSDHIYEKGDGPYRGFGYSGLFLFRLAASGLNQRKKIRAISTGQHTNPPGSTCINKLNRTLSNVRGPNAVSQTN